MTTSFLEQTMAGYDSEPESPEDHSNNASPLEDYGTIHPDDLFLQSSTKFIEWQKQCQDQDRDTIWDSWHKIYAIIPNSRFLLAVKDFERYVSLLVVKEGFKDLFSSKSLQEMHALDTIWAERMNGALAQSRVTSSKQLDTILTNLNKLLSEGYLHQEAMIQSFKTILSSAKTVQENANIFSKEIHELIPLLKNLTETTLLLHNTPKVINMPSKITLFTFREDKYEIKYNTESKMMDITPAVPQSDIQFWRQSKDMLIQL